MIEIEFADPLFFNYPMGKRLKFKGKYLLTSKSMISTIGGYSLVPKERHVQKEGNGSTLWLSNGPKESHDSTVVKKLFQKGVMTAVLV